MVFLNWNPRADGLRLSSSCLFMSNSQLISHAINIRWVSPLNDGGLIKKSTNSSMLITPKNKEGFASFFHAVLRLKLRLQAIIAILKLSNAIRAEKPWMSPVAVTFSPGTSVLNKPDIKIPTHQQLNAITADTVGLKYWHNPIISNSPPVKAPKKPIVITQPKLPTAYSLIKFVRICLSVRRKCIPRIANKKARWPSKLMTGIFLAFFNAFTI